MKSKKWMALALAASLAVGAFATPYTTFATDEEVPQESSSTEDLQTAIQEAKEILKKAEQYKDNSEEIQGWYDALDRVVNTNQQDADHLMKLTKELKKAVEAYEKTLEEKEQEEEDEAIQPAMLSTAGTPNPTDAEESKNTETGDPAGTETLENKETGDPTGTGTETSENKEKGDSTGTGTETPENTETGDPKESSPELKAAIDQANAALDEGIKYKDRDATLKSAYDALYDKLAAPTTEDDKDTIIEMTNALKSEITRYENDFQTMQNKLKKALAEKVDVTGLPQDVAKAYQDAIAQLEDLVQKGPAQISLEELKNAESALDQAMKEVQDAKDALNKPKEDSEAVKAAKVVLKAAEKYKDDKAVKPAYDALKAALEKDQPDDATVKALAEKLNAAVKEKEQPSTPKPKEEKEDSAVVKAAKATLKAAEKYKDDKEIKPLYDALKTALEKEQPDDATVKTLAEKLEAAVKAKEKPDTPKQKEDSDAVKAAKSALKAAEKYLDHKDVKKAYDALKKALEKETSSDKEIFALTRDLNAAVLDAMKPEEKEKAENYPKLLKLLKKAYKILQKKYDNGSLGKKDRALYEAYLYGLEVANTKSDSDKEVNEAIKVLNKALEKYEKPVKKNLPKTGVQEVSALAMAASALIGAGVVVSKKRK